MFVRFLASLAVTAGLFLAAPAAAATTDSRTKGTVATAFKVEYRRPGTSLWTTKSSFPTHEAARAEATRLFDAGHDVRLTRAESVTWLKTQTGRDDRRPATAPSGDMHEGISVVSYARAVQIFNTMAARSDIAFRYVPDGCYARAHLMNVHMQSMGLRPGKGWAFADNSLPLVAKSGSHPKGFVVWGYHVAPSLKVRKQDGTIMTCIIDPSLSTRPVSLAAWQKSMMYDQHKRAYRTTGPKPRMDVTVWGQAPRDASGKRMPGRGYSPGGQPADPTRAARETMAKYKPHQGTDWTPPARVASRGARSQQDVVTAIPSKELMEKVLAETPQTSE